MTFQSPVPAKFSLLPVLFCKNNKYFQISQDKVQYGILIYILNFSLSFAIFSLTLPAKLSLRVTL